MGHGIIGEVGGQLYVSDNVARVASVRFSNKWIVAAGETKEKYGYFPISEIGLYVISTDIIV